MGSGGRDTPGLVPLDRLGVAGERIGGAPIVNRVLARLGLDALLAEQLPADPRCTLEPAITIGVLVRNLALAREPLYGIADWAAGYAPELLGLQCGQATSLSDDRVGRALDALFDADRASMLTALTLRMIGEFEVGVEEFHNDSTSIKLVGDYRNATGRHRGGVRAPAVVHGHSKDHRPDLKQLVWILTVSADGAVPICYRLADGNTADDPTHVPTWDALRALLGTGAFLYVADCKLCSREAMDHIDRAGGRFLTVLPRSRAEDGAFRGWLVDHCPDWVQASRRPGRCKNDPDEIWWTTPAPTCSAEGYRIVWLRSATGIARDAARRGQQLRDGTAALAALRTRLANPRCRLASKVAVEQAAATALADTGAQRWIGVSVIEHTEQRYRQARRGRPGPATDYRQTVITRYDLTWRTDDTQVRADAASDGCWPLITNDRDLSDAELFAAYRYQPGVEGRHHVLKSVLHIAPVWLKSQTRIDALGFCFYLALLVHALIERDCRRAMTAAGVHALPLYHEDRDSTSPTAARLLDTFADCSRTLLTIDGQTVKAIPPDLTPLHRQILELLAVPTRAYTRSG